MILAFVASNFRYNSLSNLPAEIGTLSKLGTFDLQTNQVSNLFCFKQILQLIRQDIFKLINARVQGCTGLNLLIFNLVGWKSFVIQISG